MDEEVLIIDDTPKVDVLNVPNNTPTVEETAPDYLVVPASSKQVEVVEKEQTVVPEYHVVSESDALKAEQEPVIQNINVEMPKVTEETAIKDVIGAKPSDLNDENLKTEDQILNHKDIKIEVTKDDKKKIAFIVALLIIAGIVIIMLPIVSQMLER
jgi:hypothetical protein